MIVYVTLTPGRDLYYGWPVDDEVRAGDGDDEVYGLGGNDYLVGGSGHDWLYGGSGNDYLGGGSGHDHLYGEAGNDDLYGHDGDDTLSGGAGADFLNGGTGIDAMFGGLGDDWYVVDDPNDSVVEFSGQGHDTVYSWTATYTLPVNVEDLDLEGAAVEGYGNSLNNIITGNNSYNFLSGGGGSDTLYGEGGSDSLLGGNGYDILYGGAGDDVLDGGASFDDMYGGAGDDYYVVDLPYDFVIELAGEGIDIVEYWGAVDYSLPANVEDLRLRGSAAIAGSGNGLNNTINGNSGANELLGYEGNDTLLGAEGDDFLDGGSGSDAMFGGEDDDVYRVDNYGDYVYENVGRGEDTVYSSISYTLGANVENLILVDAAPAANGTGNALDNYIRGNSWSNNVLRGEAGDDELDGGVGADTMYGGTGNDVFHVGQSGDVVIEYVNEGIDEVITRIDYTLGANVEHLTLLDAGGGIDGTGNGRDNHIQGNGFTNVLSGLGGWDWLRGYGGNDILWGDAGRDTLDGGAGADMLYGGTDTDWFVFGSAAETTDGVFHDRVMDFSSAQGDRIDISAIDANNVLAGNQAFTYIGAAAFTGSAGQLSYVGGFMRGDINGDQIADFMIEVNVFSLSATDFVL